MFHLLTPSPSLLRSARIRAMEQGYSSLLWRSRPEPCPCCGKPSKHQRLEKPEFTFIDANEVSLQ